MAKYSSPPTFKRNLWLTSLLLVVAVLIFGIYVWSEKQIDRANEVRLRSFLLADELRQTSDDLTRMVRTYVTTRDVSYKQHYLDIIDIRNGKKARPAHYQRIYWDLFLPNQEPPRPDSAQKISLLDLMKRAGFTDAEFTQLLTAISNSDALTILERKAIELVESVGPDAEENRNLAITSLYDEKYHLAKASIMKPIDDFYVMVATRTYKAVDQAEKLATVLRILFVFAGIGLIAMLLRSYVDLRRALGGSADEVRQQIEKIGSGDFSAPIELLDAHSNSVMGWLEQTRADLQIAYVKNVRLSNLYSAISRGNEAITRCANEQALFESICQTTVDFGKFEMAWIGLVEETTKLVKPIAFYGDGTDYLQGLRISIKADESFGLGPTGTAIRNNKPYWCQDYQSDPHTAPWHERAKQFNWRSSAAIPILRNGLPVGAFTLYSNEIGTFDEDARTLLNEMVIDINLALDNFDRATLLRKSDERLKVALRSSIQGIYDLNVQTGETVVSSEYALC